MPSVSIIIPVHRGGKNFSACLRSLRELNPAPMEIIVVVDGHDDGSAAAAERLGARIMLLPNRSGPAAGRNMGAKAAKGEILFFIDADVTVYPNALESVETAFGSCPDLAAVIGSYDASPFETNFLSQFKNLLHHYTHQRGSDEASTFWGACGAIRRAAFFSVGGFDDKAYSTPSIEDIDLGYRLKRSGKRIRSLKKLHVKHLKRWNLRSLLKADFFYRALPWTALIIKEGRVLNDLNVSISERINLVLSYIVLLSLVGSLLTSWFIALTAYSGMVLLYRNRSFYTLLFRVRGIAFLGKSLVFHWFYYLYCGIAFLTGLCIYLFGNGPLSDRPFFKRDAPYE